jgi:deoxyribodipyrimidine photo-lyase
MVETGGLTLSPTPAAMAINTTQLAKDSRNTNTNHHITIDAFYRAYLTPTAALDKQLTHVGELAQLLYPAGEAAAQSRLDDFLKKHIADYNTARDVPALNNHLGATSRLSPYLAIGMLSPRLCYLKARQKLNSLQGLASEKDIMRWISELAWRDFYYDVMVNRADIVKGNAFSTPLDESVAWRYDLADFESWYQGKTGVPLVDAAMRCLNSTGFMHNRLRMVVAMYLSKNLLIDWRWGEAYFMQHLVDGDFASNNGGWQWSASVGTDAQPYFRVMNPFSQAATHDPDASYIQHWLPELATVPANIINDEQKLQTYLTQNPHIAYPKLNTPTKASRAMAIDAFKKQVE